MEFESLDDVIKFAIEKEIEAAEFYETAAAEESLSGSKEMFLDFAKEERKHQKMLENLTPDEITDSAPKKAMDLKRSDYLTDMEYKPGMGFRDILMVGMKREEKAMKLYAELEGQYANQDKLQKLFSLLVQEESKHKLALETMYDDFMAQMGD